jgi:prevent-host-death family protein
LLILKYELYNSARRCDIKVNSSTARDEFPELVARAGYSGERIVIERRGKAIAAIISHADLERLEALEDVLDSALLREAVAESDGESLTLEEVIARRGLSASELDE